MRPYVIGIDFDDVIAGFNQAFIAYMREVTGSRVTYETHTSFFFEEVYGIPQSEMLVHLERFCHTRHHEILPLAGVRGGLQLLSNRYELHLITSRCESLWDITCDWLSQHRLNVFTDYHFTNSASMRFPERKRLKSQVCREIGAVALIEDALHNAADVTAAGVRVIMPLRPWNQHGPLPEGVAPPLSNWKAIVSAVDAATKRLAA